MLYDSFAPVAFFVYKRAGHTLKALYALQECQGFAQTPVFVFCDGARHPSDSNAVFEARAVVKQLGWQNLTIVERQENWGLAKSIISGVTELCGRFGRVIVLEDDLEVSPYFLAFMNLALTKYEKSEQVMQVSGYMFPISLEAQTDAILLPFTTSWGWATWSRAWKHFDPSAGGYATLINNKGLRHRFDLNGSYPYFKALGQQQQGKLNSWAILWYLSVFMREGLVLYPVHSLVRNNGFDGTGTNWKATDTFLSSQISDQPIQNFPESEYIDTASYEKIVHYLKYYNNPIRKLMRRLYSRFFKA